ncbi:MAG: hypothetical protein RL607_1798 [Bacteroidota bacterium]|jgi:phosphohistidine phosphatase
MSFKRNRVAHANQMKSVIQKELVHADFVFLKSAVRTRTTAQICLEGLNFDPKAVLIIPELYTFEVQKLETFVKKLDSRLIHVFLFGHNSAITDFVNKFGDRYIENVTTSGWVTLEFKTTSWNQIQRGRTIRFRSPNV